MLRLLVLFVALLFPTLAQAEADQPNILWITSEDHGPQMGCYGDRAATTPNVDALAKRGLRYRYCWSNAPVCAPARTTLITGLYATSSGGHHMRSMVSLPSDIKLFPHYLREAGYYCTNNSKEDYNVRKPKGTWDVSSPRAHWRGRREGQPFFAVFNSTKSHESQIRTRPHVAKHDPANMQVPAYHPDTPEVRQDWAQYYDQVTAADADAGKVLEQLHDDGLTENTIVFYFGDHGSGMPRSKRSPCNSGLHVPLVLHVPERYRHLAPPEYKPGGASDRLVSFVDFAPTVLSLASVKPPEWMQGHAFAGTFIAPPPPFVVGYRDRMDERYDLIRSVRNEHFVYVRNYLPHLPYGQHVQYMFQTPTTQVWKRLHDAGKLTPAQDIFWGTKPTEELYDLRADPDEVHNLAARPEHEATLEQLRAAHELHVLQSCDLGFLPEAEMLRRAAEDAPLAMAQDNKRYPLARVQRAAALASDRRTPVQKLQDLLADDDSAVRYWGAIGLLVQGETAVKGARPALQRAQNDKSPPVRIVAAEALARHGEKEDFQPAVKVLLELSDAATQGAVVPIAALNAIDALGEATGPARDALAKMPAQGESPDPRYRGYTGRLPEDIRANLGR